MIRRWKVCKGVALTRVGHGPWYSVGVRHADAYIAALIAGEVVFE